MGYSENSAHVRIDFYKPESGKWYMTEVLDMTGEYNAPSPFAAVRNALAKTRHGRLAEQRWILSIRKPYHENGYPILLTPGKATYEPWPTIASTFDGTIGEDGGYSLYDWSHIYHIRVTDPDGWHEAGIALIDPIDQDQFFRLVIRSTIVVHDPRFHDELQAWKDAHP